MRRSKAGGRSAPTRVPALTLLLTGLLTGCGDGADRAVADPTSQESMAQVEPWSASADASAEPVVLDRSNGYTAELVRRSMRGIRYEGGALAIDAEEARHIIAGPDTAGSERALAEGRELIAVNRRTEAVASMTRAVLLAPDSAAAYEGLGDALTVRRKYDEAAAAFRAGLSRAPRSALLNHKLGDVLVRLDQRAAAIASFRRALEADPGLAQARERLALQLYYTGDPRAAWTEVHALEALGGAVPPQFRALLAQVESEPGPGAGSSVEVR